MLTRCAKAYSNNNFYRGTSCAGFLEPKKSRLGPLKSMFNAKIFIRSSSPYLAQSILVQFALEMFLAALNQQKIH